MTDLVSSLSGYDIGIISYRPTNLDYIYSAPNKLFEYMMAGMAVVGSDLPVIKEVIRSSGCGVVFNPDDPKSIADAINSIMHNPKKLILMKEASCRAAKNRWNWEVQSAPLIEEYRRLIP
jgi:glycosyltransferase involved in cell wall biosynthesis